MAPTFIPPTELYNGALGMPLMPNGTDLSVRIHLKNLAQPDQQASPLPRGVFCDSDGINYWPPTYTGAIALAAAGENNDESYQQRLAAVVVTYPVSARLASHTTCASQHLSMLS